MLLFGLLPLLQTCSAAANLRRGLPGSRADVRRLPAASELRSADLLQHCLSAGACHELSTSDELLRPDHDATHDNVCAAPNFGARHNDASNRHAIKLRTGLQYLQRRGI